MAADAGDHIDDAVADLFAELVELATVERPQDPAAN